MDADELYVLPPEQFTAARDAAAKAVRAAEPATARQLKALRRPSVSAWLVNLLAANEGALLDQLLELGPALARAQADGQGDQLRALGAQRRELVEAVTARAAALADRQVTAAVRSEVSATLDAALADPGAAEAVRTGRLVRPLSYAGFGGVDLDGAVAVPRAAPPATPRSSAAEVAALEAAALEAAGRLDDAVRACERRERERTQAQRQQEQSDRAVEQARQRLQDAESAAAATRDASAAAEGAAAEAVTAVRAAQETAERARAELDRARRTGKAGLSGG